jgi:hypothetical protein
MPADLLTLDRRLRAVSRLPSLAQAPDISRYELAVLVFTGGASALLTTFLNFRLGIPGHHIVFAIFPLAVGFALVPRHLAGTIMSASALVTIGGLSLTSAHIPGVGVLTGLMLSGPLLDFALRWGRNGWRLYGAFVAAGAAANVGAFAVRAAAKYAGIGGLGGGRSFAAWLPVATWTYAVAGVLAGLLSAVVWFRYHAPGPEM